MTSMTSRFRSIPAVNDVLCEPNVARLADAYSHAAIVTLVRQELDAARGAVSDGGDPPTLSEVANAVEQRATNMWRAWPASVINATGVVLHTNLGRAPLSAESLEAAAVAGSTYSSLEFDLDTGRRGSRQARISELVCQATGAEDALVVNNNASAVMLGLAAIAAGKDVIVSRGEAVEIGGGFRIPDVLRQSGARLVEVGTTNRTYAADYEAAIGPDTGAILAVHASNFRVMGFVHSPTIAELTAVGERHQVPVLHDLGSGCMLDTPAYGLAPEPTPQASIAAGVALGFFSGDKLLGGPQAGIVVGKREFVNRSARHPLARAVRIDKLSMAALAATMLHYIRGEAESKIPIWRMIAATPSDLKRRATRWAEAAGDWAAVTRSRSAIGGGSLPGETMPTVALSIDPKTLDTTPNRMLSHLRDQLPPIIGRIEDEHVLLDPRTVLPEQDEAVIRALTTLTTSTNEHDRDE